VRHGRVSWSGTWSPNQPGPSRFPRFGRGMIHRWGIRTKARSAGKRPPAKGTRRSEDSASTSARDQLSIDRAKKTPAEPGFLVSVSADRQGPTTNPKSREWAAASSASAFPFFIGDAAHPPRQREESYP
jgi:hypothetical protein